MIYFVGAGSGAPDLITVRGAKLLGEADVIVYAGSLVNPALLDYAKPGCAIYDSAKMTLEEVIDVMVPAAREGKTVVRLHTGDPCVYGAHREQMDALDRLGLTYEVCPGVSSFCGAAAARLGRALCEDGEMLHIIPASHGREREGLALPGSKVLMKAGRGVLRVRDELRESGQLEQAALVERCGMEGERVICELDELDEPSGYFSIILVKEERK